MGGRMCRKGKERNREVEIEGVGVTERREKE